MATVKDNVKALRAGKTLTDYDIVMWLKNGRLKIALDNLTGTPRIADVKMMLKHGRP